jgi:hypothetical protein
MRRTRLLALMLAACAGVAWAHSAPNSWVKVSFLAHSVQAEVRVPESELAFATAAERAQEPFEKYLLRHLSAETNEGVPWSVKVQSVRSTVYLDHAYLSADVELTPPAGASPDDFVLVDDVITHEVRNHTVLVLAQEAGNSRMVGALQYPARRLTVQRPAVAAASR